nr:MAG TPA: hypothetical protein [Caudoviricetes sp.]
MRKNRKCIFLIKLSIPLFAIFFKGTVHEEEIYR